MPMHDWTTVDAGIYHDLHHAWIYQIKQALNDLLPADYYALAEQHAGDFGPDVLALQNRSTEEWSSSGSALATRPRPKSSYQAETPNQFYRRKQNAIAIRHVSGDQVVAMIEIISPGNKSSNLAMKSFLDKACELLQHQVHLLIIDPFPPGKRDPQGIHGAIWERLVDDSYQQPDHAPLTLVSYESFEETRAYIEPFAVGAVMPDMPLYLARDAYIDVPLERTYRGAWDTVPQRWKRVIAPS